LIAAVGGPLLSHSVHVPSIELSEDEYLVPDTGEGLLLLGAAAAAAAAAAVSPAMPYTGAVCLSAQVP
jgi:hypothetical protein